jgi:hypothetical protein
MLLVKVKFDVIMYLIYLMGPLMKLGMTLQAHDVIESKPDYKVMISGSTTLGLNFRGLLHHQFFI